MKTLLSPLAAAALLLLMAAAPLQDGPFVFQDESAMWLEGTSNLHDWSCDVSPVVGALFTAQDDDAAWDEGRVTIMTSAIDCDNGTMNRKLRDALEADAHPQITFDASGFEAAVPGDDGWFDLRTSGTLTVAGSERLVDITARGKRVEDGRFRFTGSTNLLMTDFGIDPPTAVFGTLKTGDEVTVRFDVVAAR
jgi:polyisoprenoid-binding protein YceI